MIPLSEVSFAPDLVELYTEETPNKGRLHFLRNGSNKGLFQKSLICHFSQSMSNKGLFDQNSVQLLFFGSKCI